MSDENILLNRLNAAYDYLRSIGTIHTRKDFADALNRPSSHISSAFKGDSKRLTKGLMERIGDVFPMFNSDWLLGEDVAMLKDEEVIVGDPNQSGDVIPLLPVEAIAGGLQYWSRSVEIADCRKIVSPIPGADFAIQVSGDSMEPEIHNGTYIYIKRINNRAFIPWGHTMVVDTENGVVVKKLFPIKEEPDKILAKSVNPAYPPFSIPIDSIFAIYRVLGGSFVVSTL